MVSLAQGDLAAARAVLRNTPEEVEPAELVAYVGNFWDLDWVLDEQQQRLLVGLSPGQFDDDRGAWGGVIAQAYGYRGDQARARAYADSGAHRVRGTAPRRPGRRAAASSSTA